MGHSHTILLNQDLNDQETLRLLKELIIQLVNKLDIPEEEKQSLLENSESVAKNILHGMKTNDQSIQLQNLDDPEYRKKLVPTLMMGLIIGKNEKLMEKLEDLRFEFDQAMENNQKFHVDDKEAKEIMFELYNCKKELRQILKLEPKPIGAAKEEADADAKAKINSTSIDDVAMNLYGLVSMYTTGGLAAVVTYFMGNYQGIVDQNPEHGFAPIDQGDRISFEFGDPEGLEMQAIENYLAEGIIFGNGIGEEMRTKLQYGAKLTPT